MAVEGEATAKDDEDLEDSRLPGTPARSNLRPARAPMPAGRAPVTGNSRRNISWQDLHGNGALIQVHDYEPRWGHACVSTATEPIFRGFIPSPIQYPLTAISLSAVNQPTRRKSRSFTSSRVARYNKAWLPTTAMQPCNLSHRKGLHWRLASVVHRKPSLRGVSATCSR